MLMKKIMSKLKQGLKLIVVLLTLKTKTNNSYNLNTALANSFIITDINPCNN